MVTIKQKSELYKTLDLKKNPTAFKLQMVFSYFFNVITLFILTIGTHYCDCSTQDRHWTNIIFSVDHNKDLKAHEHHSPLVSSHNGLSVIFLRQC